MIKIVINEYYMYISLLVEPLAYVFRKQLWKTGKWERITFSNGGWDCDNVATASALLTDEPLS
jgi:hypothetical protein